MVRHFLCGLSSVALILGGALAQGYDRCGGAQKGQSCLGSGYGSCCSRYGYWYVIYAYADIYLATSDSI